MSNVRMITEVSFISLLLFSSVFGQDRIYTPMGSSVELKCNIQSQSTSRWIFEGNLLFFNRIHSHFMFADSVTLSRDYSLLIDPVKDDHEGTYKCKTENNSSSIAQYVLTIAGL